MKFAGNKASAKRRKGMRMMRIVIYHFTKVNFTLSSTKKRMVGNKNSAIHWNLFLTRTFSFSRIFHKVNAVFIFVQFKLALFNSICNPPERMEYEYCWIQANGSKKKAHSTFGLEVVQTKSENSWLSWKLKATALDARHSLQNCGVRGEFRRWGETCINLH